MRYSLNFQSPHDIIDFVKIVNGFEYDVDVVSGKKIVDAKSVVGVMALSKAGEVDVIAHAEECGEFLRQIRPYLKQEKSA
ncbi:MAG: HPr family phosphocarrier protein [Ruminococcus sp.]|jgi:phosphocarrier protein HPr